MQMQAQRQQQDDDGQVGEDEEFGGLCTMPVARLMVGHDVKQISTLIKHGP